MNSIRLDPSKITDLYTECIKLATANKINAKNTWELNLIEHMEDVMGTVEEDGNMNFQKAGCTIDAGAKIYSSRVDSVLKDTYKVMAGLNRNDKKGGKEFDEENLGEDGKMKMDEESKSKRMKNRSTVTLEMNPESIQYKKLDLEFEVDPMFKKTSAAFDEGGARGLLLNHLCVRDGCTVVLDSTTTVNTASSKVKAGGNKVNMDTDADFSALDDIFAAFSQNLDSLGICPGLTDMHNLEARLLNAEEATEEEVLGEIAADFGTQDTGFSGNYNNYDDFDDDDDMDDGGPLDFGGGEAMDWSDNDDNPMVDTAPPTVFMSPSKEAVDGGAFYGHIRGGEKTATGDTVPQLTFAQDGSEFSFLDAGATKSWAGASHWKYRPAFGGVKRRLAATTTTKSKKQAFLVDFFSADSSVDDAVLSSPKKASANVLTDATLVKLQASDNILPIDVKFSGKRLQTLFNRPSLVLHLRRLPKSVADSTDLSVALPSVYAAGSAAAAAAAAAMAEHAEDEDGVMDMDQAGDFGGGEYDMLMFDTVNDFGDDSDDGDDNDGLQLYEEDKPEKNGSGSGFNNFVAEPSKKVQKLDINYAKFAKKVDVRALKQSIWSELKVVKEADKTNKKKKKDEEQEGVSFQTAISSLYVSL